MHITESSTFVVDLNSLKHPNDVKKDEFGKWHYNGSHVVSYAAWKSQSSSKLQFERASCNGTESTFQLRRIRCRHPSNPQFQRLLAFVTGKYIIDCAMLVCHPASFSSIHNQVTNPILLAVFESKLWSSQVAEVVVNWTVMNAVT